MFKELFNRFVVELVSEHGTEELKNQEYKTLLNKRSQLWEKIKDLIPQEVKEELDDIDVLIECHILQVLYTEGLKDGLKLSKILEIR